MIELNERAIAFHEAGHAAVGIYFDEPIERVSIVQNDHSGGVVVQDRSLHDSLRDNDETEKQVPFERAIMVAMAGEIAQRKAAPDSVDDEHAAADRHVAHEYFDELDAQTQDIRDAYWRLLELRTAALLERLWPRVERIAAALVKRKTLTGAEAEVAFADPELRRLFDSGEGKE